MTDSYSSSRNGDISPNGMENGSSPSLVPTPALSSVIRKKLMGYVRVHDFLRPFIYCRRRNCGHSAGIPLVRYPASMFAYPATKRLKNHLRTAWLRPSTGTTAFYQTFCIVPRTWKAHGVLFSQEGTASVRDVVTFRTSSIHHSALLPS